jgi:hypothetical protein
MNSLLDHTPLNSDLINIIVKYEDYSLQSLHKIYKVSLPLHSENYNIHAILLKCVRYKSIGITHCFFIKEELQSLYNKLKIDIETSHLKNICNINLYLSDNYYQITIKNLNGCCIDFGALSILP